MRPRRRNLVLLLAATGLVALLWVGHAAQRADYAWDPALERPAFRGDGPRVVIDEAHHNASTAAFHGRYWPFARLLRADGYSVERGHATFTADALQRIDVLVIANAAGAARTQVFGINLPTRNAGDRSAPAFAPAEIAALVRWIEDGGALLLIANHAPFGASAASLAHALDVEMHAGITELEGERSDPLEFSRSNGRLGAHPVLDGVERIYTFTGQSLDGPANASVLLRLPPNAIEYVEGDAGLKPAPAGAAQGLALQRGRGRIVVLGAAAMLTAQVSAGEAFGLQEPASDNVRFARNVLRWLAAAR